MSKTTKEEDYFKMGAAVAVGELFDLGKLGFSEEDFSMVRGFLGSFGVQGLQDVADLGIKGPYLRDFERIYG